MSAQQNLKLEAREQMQRGDYGGAIRTLTKALDDDNQNATLYLTRGLAYYMRHEYAPAIKDLTAALYLEPQNLDALLTRGNAYLQQGETKEAIHDYDEYINIAPDHHEAPYARRAAAHASLGHMEQAIGNYSQAIEHATDPAKLYFSRATLRYNNADYKGTLDDCTAAIDNGYRGPDVYAARGSAYAQLGLNQEAIRDYSQAIELDRRDVMSFYNRGAVHYKEGHLDSAIEDFSRAIALKPDDPTAYYARAIAHADKQDWRSARLDLTQVLKMQPDNAAARHKRATAYRHRGKDEKALADYEQAAELEMRPLYLTGLGEMYLYLGDLEQAIATLKHAIIRQQDATSDLNDRMLAALALAYYQQNEREQALRYWEMLLERDLRFADVETMRDQFDWPPSLYDSIATMIDSFES